jgi:hypothetical protein
MTRSFLLLLAASLACADTGVLIPAGRDGGDYDVVTGSASSAIPALRQASMPS